MNAGVVKLPLPEMTVKYFDLAFEHVVGLEGGYVNDPRDPGGETKFGITKRDHPQENIRNLTLGRAKEIYFKEYWAPVRASELPWPLARLVFDSAVNQGVATSVKLLQKAAGVLPDGVVGPKTLAAVERAELGELCALFLAERGLKYMRTANFSIYGRGWLKRLFKLAMEVSR